MRVNSASAGHGARYCCHTYRKGPCANPVITAGLLDTAVWTHVAAVLRDPAIIAAEVERQRDHGALERDFAAVEKMLTAIAEKQAITARAITAVDDDEAAAPLIAELKALGERKKAAQRDRDNLARRIADAEADRARVRSLAGWCAAVAANVDRLTYDEKRLALQALGVQVRVWREGVVRDDGTPQPRWELTLQPVVSDSSIVYPATSSTSGS
jgi:site-specific DNA recombinase